jgi:hypothetical protein
VAPHSASRRFEATTGTNLISCSAVRRLGLTSDDGPPTTRSPCVRASRSTAYLPLARPLTHARSALGPTSRATRGMTGRPPAARQRSSRTPVCLDYSANRATAEPMFTRVLCSVRMKPTDAAAVLRRPFIFPGPRKNCDGRTRVTPGVSPTSASGRRPSRFDGLKYDTAFRCDANDIDTSRPPAGHPGGRSDRPGGSTGLCPSACLVQVRRKREDSPPAVRRKTESDVSPGSSVTPGRRTLVVRSTRACHWTDLAMNGYW